MSFASKILLLSPRHSKAVTVVLGLFAVLVGNGICHAQQEQQSVPRHVNTNVILISLQCLRPDHLGVYGYDKNTSKHIDKLAQRSVVFDNAISQANFTPVAQMSVFTSQYPRVNGMVSFEVTKEMVSQTTLPSILKKYGYTTAATLSAPEFFMRYNTQSKTEVNPGDVFSRSFDYFGRTRSGPGGKSIRKVPTESFQWLKENKDTKFFLWIASGLIHMPYSAAVPPPFYSMYDPPDYVPFWKRLAGVEWKSKEKGSPDYDVFSRVYKGDFYWGFSPVYHLTEKDKQYVTGRYDAGVYYTDKFIGRLLELLDSLDLTKKTMVVLHSIHGEDLGEKGDFFHYDVYDSVIKNALLVSFPNNEFSGKRISEQVQGVDILPTVLDYLDIPIPHQAQGGSLLPLLKGETSKAPSEFAYIDRMPWWEYTLSKWYLDFKINDQKTTNIAPSEKMELDTYLVTLKERFDELGYPPGDIAIRTNEWKLIFRKNIELLNKMSWWSFITGKNCDVDEFELYDLSKDPLETNNVAKSNPEVVSRLKKKLLRWDTNVENQKAKYKTGGDRLIIPYPQ